MSCYYPITAYKVARRNKAGDLLFYEVVFEERKGDVIQYLKLPCGSCDGCRLERARQWAVRCVHEARMHERNCFITLTYNDEHIPDRGELNYRDFQLFMKRLRKRFQYKVRGKKYHGPVASRPIRFFMCGEYGESGRRPHFHACIFGIDFDDRVDFKTGPGGSKVYTSRTLDSLWTDREGASMGFCTVGDVSFDSAGYVARYVTKKVRGGEDLKGLDIETGEVYTLTQEFCRMSLRQGVGYEFYKKFGSDMYPNDICVVNGVVQRPPKFYWKKLVESDPELAEELSFARAERSLVYAEHNTEERLRARRQHMAGKLKLLKREL